MLTGQAIESKMLVINLFYTVAGTGADLPGSFKLLSHILHLEDGPHAAAAAAEGRLEHDRHAMLLAKLNGFLRNRSKIS